ncbi:hypothetical protein Dsin_027097 [Dipteronia sinensis]|uniref:Ribosomal protein S11 n=1 Tax=Dipteronia sinensis TaxID=43782 RepID=A0AAD9ZYZ4_9ROSI|nr:hypothetical protein Dsin_027097 [Dipteronia sinensis]
MRSLCSLRQARPFSATSLNRFYGALNQVSESQSVSSGFPGYLENQKSRYFSLWNAASAKQMPPRVLGNLGMDLCSLAAKGNMSSPYALGFRSFIHSTSQKDFEPRKSSRPMDFVRGVVEEDGKRFTRSPHFSHNNVEQNADFVNIKLLRNNTFVTVTDSKGNKKLGASSGCLPELKAGPKLSKYAAEATAEHVGRLARNFGLKSVVMRVNGFTYFKKKRQAIMSFREGFGTSRGDQNPIVYIEDTTRKPHNGCRLPKKRRI